MGFASPAGVILIRFAALGFVGLSCWIYYRPLSVVFLDGHVRDDGFIAYSGQTGRHLRRTVQWPQSKHNHRANRTTAGLRSIIWVEGLSRRECKTTSIFDRATGSCKYP
jgi:hypothetical protein